MNKKDIEELKKDVSKVIHDAEDMDLAGAASLYLQFGMTINDKLDDIDNDEDEALVYNIFYNATRGWVQYLNEEIGKPLVFDFDLWADSMRFASDLVKLLCEEKDKETPDSMLKICQGAFVGMFRMWYEDITFEDIRNFFDDKPCPELPDMSDMRKTFLWAMDNGISCHDMTSFLNHNQVVLDNQSAEDEIEYYRGMAGLRDSFDACDELFVDLGIPQEYLDEHRLELRNVYYDAISFYAMLPPNTDVGNLIDEKTDQLYRFYEQFIGIHKFPGIDPDNPENSDDDLLSYYYIIFTLGLRVGEDMAEKSQEDGMPGVHLFRDAIEHEMEKGRREKRVGE